MDLERRDMGFLLARYQDLDVYVPILVCLFDGF